MFQCGDIVTGIDRSYTRSIYRIKETAEINGRQGHMATLVSFDGYSPDNALHAAQLFFLLGGAYRVATREEVAASLIKNLTVTKR